ncbi:hypothetical protein PMAYCL1PPCAC_24567, partial [Pristionchus mayeri]
MISAWPRVQIQEIGVLQVISSCMGFHAAGSMEIMTTKMLLKCFPVVFIFQVLITHRATSSCS